MVLLTGCRQSGETSLLVLALPKHRYVSLDLPLEAERAESSGEAFLADHAAPVIVLSRNVISSHLGAPVMRDGVALRSAIDFDWLLESLS